jgi:hypothetical protein
LDLTADDDDGTINSLEQQLEYLDNLDEDDFEFAFICGDGMSDAYRYDESTDEDEQID